MVEIINPILRGFNPDPSIIRVVMIISSPHQPLNGSRVCRFIIHGI